jgi:hypothetical protein
MGKKLNIENLNQIFENFIAITSNTVIYKPNYSFFPDKFFPNFWTKPAFSCCIFSSSVSVKWWKSGGLQHKTSLIFIKKQLSVDIYVDNY